MWRHTLKIFPHKVKGLRKKKTLLDTDNSMMIIKGNGKVGEVEEVKES